MAEKIGYIKLYRSLLADDLWNDDEPFSKRDAFIDLLLRTNHKHNSVYGRPVSRGQHWTSINKLATRWHWDKRKVRRTLDLFQLDGKITYESTKQGVMITIVNYSKWQGVVVDNTTNATSNTTTSNTTSATTNATQTIMNKNDIKNDKEIKASPSSYRGWGNGES